MKPFKQILLLTLFCCASLITTAQDEFKEWNTDTVPVTQQQAAQPGLPATNVLPSHQHNNQGGADYWLMATIAATMVAGVLVRFRKGRYLRPFFLVASVGVLGFYRGSCPCPVGGFMESVLFVSGTGKIHWVWWFVAIIPLTYLLGRVWCGWVCQLGALQELIHMNGRFKVLSSATAQLWVKRVQVAAFVLLVAQLVYSQSNFWKHIDPFKAAFNRGATNLTAWILLDVLIVSSVIMYRPFCKALCPVGLVLGWIARIPGSAAITATNKCIGCKSCSTACRAHALQYDKQGVTIRHEECIACGECTDQCPVKVMQVKPKRTTAAIGILHQRRKTNAEPVGC